MAENRNKKMFAGCLSALQHMELDACTQCGECLKNCPVQEVTGNRQVSPPAKIRAFRDFIKKTRGLKSFVLGARDVDRGLLEDFTRAVFECTTCGACGKTCSVGIYTQRLWPMLRREMVLRGIGPVGAQRDMPEDVRRTGNPYGKPAAQRFAPWFPAEVKVAEKAEIGYYTGCTGAYDAIPMVKGDVTVIGKIGRPFTMLPPEEEVCCGFPLFVTGQFELLEGLVKRLVEGYAQRGVKTLVCSCPCCVNMIARDWPHFYGRKLPFGIRHISQYVLAALEEGRISPIAPIAESIIYHDPCYLSRGVGITEEPRAILKKIPGVQLLEFTRNRANSRCCGAGGAARKVFHENAVAIGRLTIDEAYEKKAGRLVLGCPACYGKVNEAMSGYEKQVKIVDVMELLSGVL
ncbi:MAG: (Fe-S)-binding protein [Actinomycetota bacterium]|nr:(Fe-S)-binding protein [Actinomycetota bacterium]